MHIIDHNWDWAYGLANRPRTDAIVLHHAAARTASPEDVHRWHRAQGWAGIGYHLYVRKDGSVHAGRPLRATGAHVRDHNSHTLGVCCEGDYDAETAMPQAQLQALREVLAYLKTQYPDAAVKRHRDYGGTVCPGKHFPFAAATAENSGRQVAAPTTHQRSAVGADTIRPKHDNDEEDSMQRFNTVSELPEAYRAAVQALIDKGFLRGRGSENALDLTEDMARVLVVCARMEGVA